VTIVVDASVLAAVALDETLATTVRPLLLGNETIAPELILAELANVIWKNVRRKLLAQADARPALEGGPQLIDRIYPIAPLVDRALNLAILGDHPAYDCFYVALAAREGVPLFTADAKLARIFAADADIRLI
jgi:predicted nucleic acid-binding protein